MPDPVPTITNPNPNPEPGKGGGAGGEGGNDPTKTVTTPPTAFDTSKLGDEDFNKIFEDPRLYKHPRFKSLNDRAKKADDYETEAEAAKTKKLEEDKKFQELADINKKKAEDAENKYRTAQIDNRIQSEAAKLGVVDLEAVLKLIDRVNLKVDETGAVTGVEDAVKALLEAKPYLKGKAGQVTVGTPTNPGQGTEGIKKFTLSQIQDPVFFRENEKDIDAALKAGLVENDLNQGQQ